MTTEMKYIVKITKANVPILLHITTSSEIKADKTESLLIEAKPVWFQSALTDEQTIDSNYHISIKNWNANGRGDLQPHETTLKDLVGTNFISFEVFKKLVNTRLSENDVQKHPMGVSMGNCTFDAKSIFTMSFFVATLINDILNINVVLYHNALKQTNRDQLLLLYRTTLQSQQDKKIIEKFDSSLSLIGSERCSRPVSDQQSTDIPTSKIKKPTIYDLFIRSFNAYIKDNNINIKLHKQCNAINVAWNAYKKSEEAWIHYLNINGYEDMVMDIGCAPGKVLWY